MEDPTARGRWVPAAAGWRDKVSKRKSFSTWVGGPGGTVCSEMPGADCNDRLFSLVFPFLIFFLASLKSSFTELYIYPRSQLFPKELLLNPARYTVFWLCCCCMGDLVRAAWRIFLWLFPLQFVQNLSKEQNPLQPCSLRTNSIPFSKTSFLVCLVKWEKRGKSHMRIDPNCHHLTFGGKNGKIFKILTVMFIFFMSTLWFKPLCKE